MRKQGNGRKYGTIRTVSAISLAVVMILVAYRYIIYSWMMSWGATADELQQKLPGDDLVAHPRSQTTMAITIHANVTAIWPWLAQMGQGRGGFYTYEWLENLLGCDIHNTDRIHSEWQAPKVGDLVRMYREGAGPPPYQIAAIEPEQALILGHPLDNDANWGDSWTFALQKIDEQNTRLIMRLRTSSSLPTAMHVMNYTLEPGYFIMYRGMLLGIKERAERISGQMNISQRKDRQHV